MCCSCFDVLFALDNAVSAQSRNGARYRPWFLLGFGRCLLICVIRKNYVVDFCFNLTVAAERRELYRFSADIAKLALRIAEKYGTPGEKWYAYL
jgi:hypothetical protein